MKRLLSAITCASLLSVGSASAFTVITEITEFTAPTISSLIQALRHLLDTYGNTDSAVNGVTFFTDRAGLSRHR